MATYVGPCLLYDNMTGMVPLPPPPGKWKRGPTAKDSCWAEAAQEMLVKYIFFEKKLWYIKTFSKTVLR